MVFTPNLIMPGVAKCGTTTLYDILVSHPAITGGIEKEVRYLMDADESLSTPINVRDCGLGGWAALYADRGEGDFRYWLDASPQYQYQDVARRVIAELDPAPRLIFVVRRPSARLFSLYQYARYHQKVLPHHRSFAEFIDAIRPPVDPRLTDQKMMVSAWVDTRYDAMLEQWAEAVPPGHIWMTSIEALGRDRRAVIGSLAAWLDLDPQPMIEAGGAHSNPTVHTRSHAVRHVGAKLARLLPENRLVRAAKNFVRELNSAEIDAGEREANARLLQEIDAEFSPHVARFNAMAAEIQEDFVPLDI